MQYDALFSRDVLPREVARRYFGIFVESSPKNLSLIADWLESATVRLSLSDCVRDVEDFAQRQGSEVENTEDVLQAFFSLEGLRATLEWAPTQFVRFLEEDALAPEDSAKNPEVSEKSAILLRLLQQSEKLELTRRAQRIYDGLLPNFASCGSLAEFRPVFDEGRESIMNGLVAATLTIEMRKPGLNPDELEKVAVQVDAADIDELIQELSRLKVKISALKQFSETQKTALLNPSRSLSVDA